MLEWKLDINSQLKLPPVLMKWLYLVMYYSYFNFLISYLFKQAMSTDLI